MRRSFGLVILSLALVLVQTTVIRYLALETITPDIVLIWIVALALTRGQMTATIAGFGLGLVMDLLAGSDGMLGLAALSKTCAGFAAGYFYNENKAPQVVGSSQFPLVVVAMALVHNILYFLVFLQGSETGWLNAIARFALPSSIYTAALALVPMVVAARRTKTLA